MKNGDEMISLNLEGSNLSIFPPLLHFLFSYGDESSFIFQTLGERQAKTMKFVVVRE